MNGRNYFMVRAQGSSEENLKTFFDNNVVAVGWSDVDFTQFSDIAKLKEKVCEVYYSNCEKRVIGRPMGQIERFKQIRSGDYIVVPCGSYIALAEAGEKEIYSVEAIEQDLANQRSVSYRRQDGKPVLIARDELSEGLQRRLRVRGNAVADLFEFGDELEKIFNCGSYSYSQEMQNLEQQEMKTLKAKLLENIRNGKTHLQTGGIGLERLVRELMECEGYNAEVLAKNKFSGIADADIRAIKEDSFMSKKIFVQVKHHIDYSDDQGIQQVRAVLDREEYGEYEGYFITSASVSKEVKASAEEQNIEVMDGEELVELIVNNLNGLSEETKRKLGICVIPRVISVV